MSQSFLGRPIDARPLDNRLDAFIAHHWAVAPALLRQALPSPICTPADMLAMLRCMSASLCAGKPIDTRFFVDGLQVPPDHPLERVFAVRPSEHTLAAYIEGVTARLDGRAFYLVIDNAALLHLEVWQRMQALAGQVLRHAGYPTGRIEFNAFVGTERFTPFGIHTDNTHTLTVAIGDQSKTMLTWPPEALTSLRPRLASKDPDEIAALATGATSWRLTDPCDLLYVPPDWWHSTIRPASCPYQASLAMGFAVEKLPSKELADLVARELRVALDARLAERGLDPERADFASADAGLSRQNARALEQARALVSPGGGVMERVDVALRLRALHRLSGLVESTRIRNLEPQFPARRAGPLPPDTSRVRLSCKLFRGLVRGHLALAANGYSFVTTASPGALAGALRLLETVAPVGLDDLGAGDGEVRRFLEFAWGARALDIVD